MGLMIITRKVNPKLHCCKQFSELGKSNYWESRNEF